MDCDKNKPPRFPDTTILDRGLWELELPSHGHRVGRPPSNSHGGSSLMAQANHQTLESSIL